MKVFLVLGIVLSVIGGSFLAWLYLRRAKVSRQIAAARHWPEATAVVDVADYSGFTAYFFGTRLAKWQPMFKYRFQAGGQTFTGDRIIFGNVQEGNAQPVRKLIAPYAPGQWIKIRYNPYDPRESVVELRHPPQPWFGLTVISLMTAFGLVMMVLGAAGVGPDVGGGRSSSSSRR